MTESLRRLALSLYDETAGVVRERGEWVQGDGKSNARGEGEEGV